VPLSLPQVSSPERFELALVTFMSQMRSGTANSDFGASVLAARLSFGSTGWGSSYSSSTVMSMPRERCAASQARIRRRVSTRIASAL
jgi:hypothetical protein